MAENIITAKQKANELFDKFYFILPEKLNFRFRHELAKQSALMTVKEILELVGSDDSILITELQYWQQVRKEIESLKK